MMQKKLQKAMNVELPLKNSMIFKKVILSKLTLWKKLNEYDCLRGMLFLHSRSGLFERQAVRFEKDDGSGEKCLQRLYCGNRSSRSYGNERLLRSLQRLHQKMQLNVKSDGQSDFWNQIQNGKCPS